jgi:hypothetical protein
MKLLIMKMYLSSCHLLLLRFKISPPDPVLKHHQLNETKSHSYKTTGEIMPLFILTFLFL